MLGPEPTTGQGTRSQLPPCGRNAHLTGNVEQHGRLIERRPFYWQKYPGAPGTRMQSERYRRRSSLWERLIRTERYTSTRIDEPVCRYGEQKLTARGHANGAAHMLHTKAYSSACQPRLEATVCTVQPKPATLGPIGCVKLPSYGMTGSFQSGSDLNSTEDYLYL